jgi:hypothetical protein
MLGAILLTTTVQKHDWDADFVILIIAVIEMGRVHHSLAMSLCTTSRKSDSYSGKAETEIRDRFSGIWICFTRSKAEANTQYVRHGAEYESEKLSNNSAEVDTAKCSGQRQDKNSCRVAY